MEAISIQLARHAKLTSLEFVCFQISAQKGNDE